MVFVFDFFVVHGGEDSRPVVTCDSKHSYAHAEFVDDCELFALAEGIACGEVNDVSQ